MTEIQESGLRGGQLLDALHQRCTTGNPVIKNMFTKLLFACHKVFFHQVNAWVVHGQLIDLCEEFFIHKLDESGESNSNTNDDTKSVMNQT